MRALLGGAPDVNKVAVAGGTTAVYDVTENVKYTVTGQTDPVLVPQAADASDCGDAPGWYYDNPSKPAKIVLCPATCESAGTEAGSVELLLGCTTAAN